jgi:hypothetical protein
LQVEEPSQQFSGKVPSQSHVPSGISQNSIPSIAVNKPLNVPVPEPILYVTFYSV